MAQAVTVVPPRASIEEGPGTTAISLEFVMDRDLLARDLAGASQAVPEYEVGRKHAPCVARAATHWALAQISPLPGPCNVIFPCMGDISMPTAGRCRRGGASFGEDCCGPSRNHLIYIARSTVSWRSLTHIKNMGLKALGR